MAFYRVPFDQYKACQKMTKNEFSKWLTAFGDAMWRQGYSKACEDVPDGAIVVNPKDTMIVNMDDEKLREVLLSVSGVGPKLCNKIIDRMYEAFDGYVSEGEK